MSEGREPIFLSREQVDAIHDHQVQEYGGLNGLRDEHGLEAAIAQPQNVYHYGAGDLFQIAGAYAFHIAQSQAYLDGNKRTAIQAAVIFMEINGIDTSRLPEQGTYEAMIKVASHEMDRFGLAEHFRSTLRKERSDGIGG